MSSLLLEYLGNYYSVPMDLTVGDYPETPTITACAFKPLPLKADEHVAFHLSDESFEGVVIEPEHVVRLSCVDEGPWWCVIATGPDPNTLSDDKRILRELPPKLAKNLIKEFSKLEDKSDHVKRLAPDPLFPFKSLTWYMREFILDGNLVKTTGPPIVSVADKALFKARKETDNYCKGFCAMKLPTADELVDALTNNLYLVSVLRACAIESKHPPLGPHRLDLYDDHVVNGSYQLDFSDIGFGGKQAIAPFLRRLGYNVEMYESNYDYPMSVHFETDRPCEIADRNDICIRSLEDSPRAYLYGRSFQHVRQRGVIKCVPRLLGWLRTARISIDDPTKHPEKLEEWKAELDVIVNGKRTRVE